MKQNLLLTFALCMTAMVSAQNGETMRGPYLTNRFQDNWFISLGGGATLYEGEEDNKGDLGKRLAPAYDLSIGKWVTPAVGLRLQYAGGEAKGFSSFKSPFSKSGSQNDGYYKERFSTNALHADLLWNASNAIAGYNPKRVWNLIPYVGFGVMRTGGNGITNDEYAAVGGLLNTFRLSNRIDLQLEARQFILRDNQNEVVCGYKREGMTSVTIGLTIKIGKTGFDKAGTMTTADCSACNEQVNALRSQLESCEAETNRLKNALRTVPKGETQTREVQPEAANHSTALFFTIGKSVLDTKELMNLEYFVEQVMKPDQNAVYTLVGSADKSTGTPAFNEKLTQRRVDYVYDLLVKRFGIDPARLKKDPQGSANNRFATPAMNRVVIIE